MCEVSRGRPGAGAGRTPVTLSALAATATAAGAAEAVHDVSFLTGASVASDQARAACRHDALTAVLIRPLGSSLRAGTQDWAWAEPRHCECVQHAAGRPFQPVPSAGDRRRWCRRKYRAAAGAGRRHRRGCGAAEGKHRASGSEHRPRVAGGGVDGLATDHIIHSVHCRLGAPVVAALFSGIHPPNVHFLVVAAGDGKGAVRGEGTAADGRHVAVPGPPHARPIDNTSAAHCTVVGPAQNKLAAGMRCNRPCLRRRASLVRC